MQFVEKKADADVGSIQTTPEQLVESRAVLDRFTRGIVDDDCGVHAPEAKKEEPQP
jgi:hypothetical protein